MLFERILQGERVDYRGQHAHVVRRYAVHFFRLFGDAPEEVPAAHDDRNLDIELVDFRQFRRDLVHACRIDAETLACRQCLTRKFEKYAFENRLRH